MIKKLMIVPVIAGAFMLSGCDDNMPPKCDSKETKALLSKVIKDVLVREGMGEVKISITGHEMTEEHAKAKEYTCEARAVYQGPGGMNSQVVNYSVFLDENKKGQFFVQLNDDD